MKKILLTKFRHKKEAYKRKTRANVGLLLNGAGNLMTKDMAKVKILNTFFISVFTGKTCLQQAQVPETSGKD